jgi:hypothetical protein
MKPSAMDLLTDKQRIFVTEYAADMNRLRAMKEAGYRGSDKNLGITAVKLLKDPKVCAALAEIGTKLDASMLNVENLATQLARMVFRNMAAFTDDEGYLTIPLGKLPEDIQQCVEGWEIDRSIDSETGDVTEKIKVKLVPKIKAMELAMKWKGMLQGVTINNNNLNVNGFDWGQFYEGPKDIVEDRIQKALTNGQAGETIIESNGKH